MSERDTWDLVKLLPIRSRETLLRLHYPPIPGWRGQDDVRAFLRLNPGLHYHSAGMFSLLSAHCQLRQSSKPVRQEPQMAVCLAPREVCISDGDRRVSSSTESSKTT